MRALSQRLASACEKPLASVRNFADVIAAPPDVPAPPSWWEEIKKAEEGGAHSSPGHKAAPHAASAGAVIQELPQSHMPAAKEEMLAGWWKDSPLKTQSAPPPAQAGGLVKGFLLPLLRLWQERDGVSLPAVAPATPAAPARTSPAPLAAAPRAVEKKRPRSRWLTCSSVTCLLLCLTAYSVLLLAQVVTQRAQSVWADVNHAPAAISAKNTLKLSTSPASTSQPLPSSGVHASRSKI